MRLLPALVVLAALAGPADAQPFALVRDAANSAAVPDVNYSAVAWADVDVDGDPDLVVTGFNGGAFVGEVYRNDGGGLVLDAANSAVVANVVESSVAWADYDGDGDLDLVVTGRGDGDVLVGEVYRNDGGTLVRDAAASDVVANVHHSDVAWADVDGDGDPDLVVTGYSSSGTTIGEVYRNDGGTLVRDAANSAVVADVYISAVAWADVDGDGDPDLVVTGYTSSGISVGEVYRNDGGTLVRDADNSAVVADVRNSAVAWADVDGDGDPDLVVTGYSSSGTVVGEVYRNDGGGLVLDAANSAVVANVVDSSVAWVDIDSDGDPDLVVTGRDSAGGFVGEVYRNDGGTLVRDAAASDVVANVHHSAVAWADVDSDGDPDLVLTGSGASVYVGEVYRNDTAPPPVASRFVYVAAPGITFADAEAAAVAMGGHLASLASDQENAAAFAQLPRPDLNVWIGFNDEAAEGQFVWTDGTPTTYTNWATGEPNNAGTASNEDCAAFWASTADGAWADFACTATALDGYVAEIPALFVDTNADDQSYDPVQSRAECTDGILDGDCTLREAILVANADPALDLISFEITEAYGADATSGIATIQPTSALPTLTDAGVTIDGTTQPGWVAATETAAATLRIELSGELSSVDVSGVILAGSDQTVRGLVINRFAYDGLRVEGDWGVVVGSHLGVSVDGTTAQQNRLSGIYVSGDDARIGTGDVADRNVLSGNGEMGITIDGDDAVVAGNYIGTNAAGTAAVPNGVDGGPYGWGVWVRAGARPRIGTDGNGTADATERNVISGNRLDGIKLDPGASSAIVAGNYIGLAADGAVALGNVRLGIYVGGAADARIGTTADGAVTSETGNVISSNGSEGIFLEGAGVRGAVIAGNRIGVAADGVTARGNGTDTGAGGRAGINAYLVTSVRIGTDGDDANDAAEGNAIAYNGFDGVRVAGGSQAVTIQGNAIFANDRLGIDLGGDGVTANDPDDPDVGMNGLQNFPVVTAATATTAPNSGTVAFTLDSTPGQAFRVELFASAEADPTGYGEGAQFLGATTVTTNAAGDATGTVDGLDFAIGEVVTATATTAGGATSEFSLAETAVVTPGDIAVSPTEVTVTEAGTTATVEVTLSRAASEDVSIVVTSADAGEALVSDDDEDPAASVTLVIPAGSTVGTVTITGVADMTDDTDQTVTVALAAATSTDAGFDGDDPADVTVTVEDTDPALVTLSVDPASVTEEGAPATLTASLSSPAEGDVVVTIEVADDGGDVTVGDDDPATPGLQIVVADGDTSGSVEVTAVDDTVDEADETVVAEITAVSGDAVEDGDQTVAITVIDDGDVNAAFSVAQRAVSEGAGTATLTIVLTDFPAAPATLTATRVSGDAADVRGFTSASVTVTPGGPLRYTLDVPVTDDGQAEGDEAFVFVLSVEPPADGSEPAVTTGEPDVTALVIVDNDGEPLAVTLPAGAGPRLLSLPVSGITAGELAEALGADALYVVRDGAFVLAAADALLRAGELVLVDGTPDAPATLTGTRPSGTIAFDTSTDEAGRVLVAVGNPTTGTLALDQLTLAGGTIADVALVFEGGAFRPVSLSGLGGDATLGALGAVVLQVIPTDDPASVTVSVASAVTAAASGTPLEGAPFSARPDETAVILTLQPAEAPAVTTAGPTGGPAGDTAVLRFLSGAEEGLDRFDGVDVASPVGPTLALGDGGPFAALAQAALAAGSPVTVPVTVAAPEAGTYEIALGSAPETVGNRQVVVELLDRGVATDLASGPVTVTATGAEGEFAGRFAVRVSLGTAVATEGAPAGLALSVFPNPTASRATVVVTGATSATRVSVVDALGREVAVLHDGPVGSGDARYEIGRLAPGLYMVRLQSVDGTATRALTVTR